VKNRGHGMASALAGGLASFAERTKLGRFAREASLGGHRDAIGLEEFPGLPVGRLIARHHDGRDANKRDRPT